MMPMLHLLGVSGYSHPPSKWPSFHTVDRLLKWYLSQVVVAGGRLDLCMALSTFNTYLEENSHLQLSENDWFRVLSAKYQDGDSCWTCFSFDTDTFKWTSRGNNLTLLNAISGTFFSPDKNNPNKAGKVEIFGHSAALPAVVEWLASKLDLVCDLPAGWRQLYTATCAMRTSLPAHIVNNRNTRIYMPVRRLRNLYYLNQFLV